MRLVVQRVRFVKLTADGNPGDTAERGLLALVGLKDGDDKKAVLDYMADKLIHLRVFEDEAGKMNLSVEDVRGELFLVSNFTLYGDCRHGRRPSYTESASHEAAGPMFDAFVETVRANTAVPVKTGVFRADMQIETCLDGPVTLLLDSDKTF